MQLASTANSSIPKIFKDNFIFDDSGFFTDKIGERGINPKNLEVYNGKLKEIFSKFLSTDVSTQYYRIMHGFDLETYLTPCEPVAKTIKDNFSDLVVVAMGGANLNPMSALSLAENSEGTRIHYLNNTDENNFVRLLRQLDPKTTAVLTTSNSGNTTETIALFSSMLNWFEENGIADSENHFFYILGEGDNALRKMANEIGGTLMSHDSGVGGRFSGFTNVCLLPGLVAGLDMREYLNSANDVAEYFLDARENSIMARFALCSYLMRDNQHVINAYSQRLDSFVEWYCQIISESLGKDGKGILPVKGVGPQDQHSMMQLYLDGPSDKTFTMINVKDSGVSEVHLSNNTKPEYLAVKTLGEINNAEFHATCAALRGIKAPVRTIEINKLNEASIGALMMHSALEVITTGYLMSINPFDQPGVEKIKIEARRILSGK